MHQKFAGYSCRVKTRDGFSHSGECGATWVVCPSVFMLVLVFSIIFPRSLLILRFQYIHAQYTDHECQLNLDVHVSPSNLESQECQ